MSGIYHSWNGTVLTVTSDSGTSSADLQGEMGVRGPQGAAGTTPENIVYLEEKVNEIEESLNGYVTWEGFNTELDSALECYPTNDELWENYYTKEETESLIAPQYELIQNFTLTETTKTVELSGFELDKFVLYIYSPVYTSDSGCRVQVSKGEEQVFNQWVNNILRKDKNNTVAFFGRNESGLAFIEYAAGVSDYKGLTTVPGYIEGITPFTKINFVMSAADFLAETKFELWGVRR